MTDHIYDLEVYPNFFSCTIVNTETNDLHVFEISTRVDHGDLLRAHLMSLHHAGDRMVGFNNEGFDYPILHTMMNGVMSYAVAYDKCDQIINGSFDDRFRHIVWPDQRLVEQIDLYKIHHFDNVSRSTSLKVLEFNMRSKNVEDLPFPPGTVLTPEQMDTVIKYNIHDVTETWSFYLKSLDRIRFREELTERYDRYFMNHNDTKIGKDFFIMQLNAAGVQTHNDRKPLQSVRSQIHLVDAVFPWIEFKQPEFNRILNWFKSQTITQTKGDFDDVHCTVGGFDFVFGLGGIHGSIDSTVVRSDEDFMIIDLDVASYYPNLAIANRLYPEHLSEKFCDIYQDVFEQRKGYPKGTAENAMLKLALNGVYGDSNSQYSPFYDPLYTMSITINGQLLLCKLAENLMEIPDLTMIQINTDGLTVRVPRFRESDVQYVASKWEMLTKLQLESVEYNRMFIRDVNNYIGEYTDGKLKRKGAYTYGDDLDWNQNHGGQVIAKAVEAALVHGVPVREFITGHLDLWDFFLLAKVPKSSKLLWGEDDVQLQNTTRYYIAKEGGSLTKLMPPLAKNPDQWRRIGINKGWKAWICNDVSDATVPVDYEYYIQAAEKLLV